MGTEGADIHTDLKTPRWVMGAIAVREPQKTSPTKHLILSILLSLSCARLARMVHA